MMPIGIRESILLLLSALQSSGPKYGLHLNLSKGEVFWPTGNQSFPELSPEVQRVVPRDGGVELLQPLALMNFMIRLSNVE